MIKKIEEDIGQNYHNIVELTWLFLLAELHDFLSFFGVYDITNQMYNYRRLWWVSFVTLIVVVMCGMFLLTSSVFLLDKLFGVF